MVQLTAALALAFIAPAPADNPRMAPVEGPIFFEWLSEARARQLHVEWVTVRLRIDSLPGEHNGYTLYNCVNRDGLHRTVWFLGEPEFDATKPLTTRGRLFVIRHKPNVIDGTTFEGFTEIRVMGPRC